MNKTIHHGHNIKRFREMLGIKQESLAHNLGTDWNQKKISILEGKPVIDEPLLEQVATAIKIPAQAIRNFDEEAAINIISHNTFNDNSTFNAATPAYIFSTVDKLIAVMEEKEKIYEQLIASEREKNKLLKKLLEEKG